MRHPSSVVFLVDCNNFFVSCEQVFKPWLIGKPVIVLSNNDGCAVSRSQEAKDLGIAMGVPLFKIKHLVKAHNVQVFSSNFSLYADMSARVMQTISQMSEQIEIYSIDEAFLLVEGVSDVVAYARQLRARIKKHTGIPVSIGIGSTKTRAKVAAKKAKKMSAGVFQLIDDELLKQFPVADIWGIGRRYSKKLADYRITNAYDFMHKDDAWIKKNFTLMGLKTALELRGQRCIEFSECPEAKQSLCVSRSFSRLISSRELIEQAVATHIIRAAQKLRNEKQRTYMVGVFIMTSRYSKYENQEHYFNTAYRVSMQPTDYTPTLLKMAHDCLAAIFRQGYQYKKVGVLLSQFVPHDQIQLDIVSTEHDATQDHERQRKLMATCDTITHKFGSASLTYAAAGSEQTHKWHSKKEMVSQRYTTNWHELLEVS